VRPRIRTRSGELSTAISSRVFDRKIRVERLEAVRNEMRRYGQNNNYPIEMP